MIVEIFSYVSPTCNVILKEARAKFLIFTESSLYKDKPIKELSKMLVYFSKRRGTDILSIPYGQP